jgi:hypothetical protein
MFGQMQGEKHKRIPKEFRKAHEKQPLIAHKQFYFYVRYPITNIVRSDLLAFAMEHRHAVRERNIFVEKVLGDEEKRTRKEEAGERK